MSEGTFYFEFQPTHWPPITTYRISKLQQYKSVAELFAFMDGHIAIIISSHGQSNEQHFQQVSIQSGSIVKIAFSWGPAGILASAGGHILSKLEESNGVVQNLKIKNIPTYKRRHLTVPPEMILRASRRESLFLKTLEDLTRKISSASHYELVRMSALLRQLLCDNPTLVHEINRQYKKNLLFEVSIKKNTHILDALMPETALNTLFPEMEEEVASVDLQRFLKLTVIKYRGVNCTVGDVIDVVAHAYGGVHHGQLRNDENRILNDLENDVLVNDESIVLHSLIDIARVTIHALLPLAESIVNKNAQNT